MAVLSVASISHISLVHAMRTGSRPVSSCWDVVVSVLTWIMSWCGTLGQRAFMTAMSLRASNWVMVKFVCLLLFYAIATVFQLYHGSDMMYEMRRREPKSTL